MPETSVEQKLAVVATELIGKSVPRPSGTLAGHASGLPFEDLVHDALLAAFPGRAYRHFELLNAILTSNPDATTADERQQLLGPAGLRYLLARGKAATRAWSPERPFQVKQNDTAESIVLPEHAANLTGGIRGKICLIDVKSHNTNGNSQPPNIISAKKVARAAEHTLKAGLADVSFSISYIGVKWAATDSELLCHEATAVSLLRIPPKSIYINWASATQIQFDPFAVSQDFTGTPVEWSRSFIDHYCTLLARRIASQSEEVRQFRQLLDSNS